MLLHQQEFTDYPQMRLHGRTSMRVSLLVNLEYRWRRMTECFILFPLTRYSLQTDNGETWKTLGPRPKGDAVGLIITEGRHPRSKFAPTDKNDVSCT